MYKSGDRDSCSRGRGVGFIISVGGFWGLVMGGWALLWGVIVLVTGSASINEGWIVLSKRQARIAGAATMVLGLVIVSIGILLEMGRFEPGEIALGVFFLFFVAVALLATIMTA